MFTKFDPGEAGISEQMIENKRHNSDYCRLRNSLKEPSPWFHRKISKILRTFGQLGFRR